MRLIVSIIVVALLMLLVYTFPCPDQVSSQIFETTAYTFPQPSLISAELVDGALELVYKQFNPIQLGGSPIYYDVWKDVYKARFRPLMTSVRTIHDPVPILEIFLWKTVEGRYIPSSTIPERFEFEEEKE